MKSIEHYEQLAREAKAEGCPFFGGEHLPGHYHACLDGECVCRTLRCTGCDAWLSLGPATDTADVLVEIRAAELASDQGAVLSMRLGGSAYWPHVWGWWAYRTGTPEPRDEHQAGWLAHAIWNHDAEQAETRGGRPICPSCGYESRPMVGCACGL